MREKRTRPTLPLFSSRRVLTVRKLIICEVISVITFEDKEAPDAYGRKS